MQRALLLALIGGSLAAFGGAPRWATAPLLGGAGLVFLAGYRSSRRVVSRRPLDAALVMTALALALQLAPLPPAAHGWLSPHAAHVTEGVHISGGGGSWRPLSLDPVATRHALATFTAALLAFWATRRLLQQGGLRGVCRGITWIGGAVAGIALVQRVVSPAAIYGWWEPSALGANPLGPFINRNHYAGWLIMALPLAAGYYVAHLRVRTRRDERDGGAWQAMTAPAGASLLLAILLMLLALTLSLSRSALVGLATASLVGWRLAQTRVTLPRGQARALVGVTGVAFLLVLTAIDPEQLTARLTSTMHPTGASRQVIWRETLPLMRDFWLTGVGGGAYGTAMLIYQQTRVPMAHLEPGSWAHFNQAHSHYVQLLAEGGLLVGVPAAVALVALIFSMIRSLHRAEGEAAWIRIGAVTGVVAIAVQSVWETALRMPAAAILCATLTAIALHERRQNPSD